MRIDRRRLLAGAAGAAALVPAACTTADPRRSAPAYDGPVTFAHGVASGDPALDRVVLWTRVTAERRDAVPVRWVIAEDPDLNTIVASGDVVTAGERDWTVKVDAAGLSPGRTYHYAFFAGTARSPVGRTRTLPAGSVARVRLIAISCSSYQWGLFNAYRQIAATPDIDAVVHLGDYIYEYGVGGYGTEVAARLGRLPDPPHEIVSLDDYRRRYAQYRSDPDLQAAHAAHPFINVWDDHESTNDSWREGAQNHDVSEGVWADRKRVAVQAFYEWLPIRDPEAGRPQTAIYRAFDFGDMVTLAMLETRLMARDQQLSYVRDLRPRLQAWDFTDPANPRPVAMDRVGQDPNVRPLPMVFDVSSTPPRPVMDARLAASIDPRSPPPGLAVLPDTDAMRARIDDPSRRMMADEVHDWLARQFSESTARGTRWQVLGNQVMMARIVAPDLTRLLGAEQRRALAARIPEAGQLIEFTRLGLPMNLDAWDGYPAARARVFRDAQAAGARLVVLTGDTHSAWANELKLTPGGERIGVEIGTTSITSPGIGAYLAGGTDFDPSSAFDQVNDEIAWCHLRGHGFALVEFGRDALRAEYHQVSDILAPTFQDSIDATFTVARGESRIGPFTPT
jgi:alkaline phosphatase D